MERHKCRLCLKSFPNGRALGGHMRSHMFNLPVVPRAENPEPGPPVQLCEETDSASSSSEEEGEEGEGTELQGYGLRENPKRSIRLVDPEFSFAAVDAASVVLQDRESETESSRNPTRRRSKRIRKPEHHQHHDHNQRQEKENARKFLKLDSNQTSKTESWPEPEPASSISNATTEEDVAFCLMLLSKDQWKKKDEEFEETQNYSVDETDNDSEDLKQSKNRSRGRYKCDTCNKVFKSYQALGGHRASHKKMRIHSPTQPLKVNPENVGTSDKKIHECPVCFRVFSTGQALGGHKRSHVIVGAVEPRVPRSSTTLGDSLIDLNLPAAAEEDDFSQIELSAVSDAEFVNQTRR